VVSLVEANKAIHIRPSSRYAFGGGTQVKMDKIRLGFTPEKVSLHRMEMFLLPF
jgi:hypothetical protein